MCLSRAGADKEEGRTATCSREHVLLLLLLGWARSAVAAASGLAAGPKAGVSVSPSGTSLVQASFCPCGHCGGSGSGSGFGSGFGSGTGVGLPRCSRRRAPPVVWRSGISLACIRWCACLAVLAAGFRRPAAGCWLLAAGRAPPPALRPHGVAVEPLHAYASRPLEVLLRRGGDVLGLAAELRGRSCPPAAAASTG